MANKPQLLDRWGNPVARQKLKAEVAAPTLGGVRSPLSGYPGDGLNPIQLASILRSADQGDPVQYLELAETIEERDPHYLGVLATRKRSVSQIEVTVEAASDEAIDVEIADMIRDWLRRDELTDEMFHILDAIGKGYSFTEILWDSSEGQWQPLELKRRDPRHFRFARHDLETPVLIDRNGQDTPLEPFHFIYANIAAKSGLALRSGLARVAVWGWMFKAFTQRDWAIFTQTYGQPLRVGKWHQGATEEDKDTLFRAVANIAGDCAAIIPDTMQIDFVESKNIASSSDHYEKRANWLDRQISKAVLGQTATTDAIAGGHAVGREHREVQEDIETADARALSAILNRDLIRPWVQLEYGPRRRYPRIIIARPKTEDIQGMSEALSKLVPLGLRVQMSEVRDRMGFAEPDAGAEVLGEEKTPDPASIPLQPAHQSSPPDQTSKIKHFSDEFKRLHEISGGMVSQQSEQPSESVSVISSLTDQMVEETQIDIEGMLETIGNIIEAAGSLEEAREMLIAAYPDIDASGMAGKLAQGMIAAHAIGRAEIKDGENG